METVATSGLPSWRNEINGVRNGLESSRTTPLASARVGVTLKNVSLDEMQRMLQRLQSSCNALRRENLTFESFLERNHAAGSSAGSKTSRVMLPTTLTLEQKIYVATSEFNEIKKQIESCRESSEQEMDQLRVGDSSAESRFPTVQHSAKWPMIVTFLFFSHWAVLS